LERLETLTAYNFYPEAIRLVQRPSPGGLLERDGSNLPSVLTALQQADPEAAQRLREYLALIAEEVESFDVVGYGEYETIRFLLRSSGQQPLRFDAASMSDGTLRALAALVAAFQGRLPDGPSLVGIEEPETSLHPAAVHALVAGLDESTLFTQVLLPTHSGDILAERDVTPDRVLVVRNRDGRTEIAPVDAASREIVRKELYSLADLHRMDQLHVDEADLARQIASCNAEG
jgi:predicted ATPase